MLVGLPGAGKSTVGRAAAARLGWEFLDFDSEIEQREGRSISRIFAESGEGAFRGLEMGLTQEMVGRAAMILAPGGGWIAIPGAVALLRPPARLIYLSAGPETLLARLANDIASRPLLRHADPLAALRRLGAERETLYASADHVLNTELIDMQSVIEKVVELASAPARE